MFEVPRSHSIGTADIPQATFLRTALFARNLRGLKVSFMIIVHMLPCYGHRGLHSSVSFLDNAILQAGLS
jgi:hypothetical protein